MKIHISMLLCSAIFFLFLVSPCLALTYESLKVDRSVNNLKQNDEVTVSGIILLPPEEDHTFSNGNYLEFYTQLDNAKWSPSIVINGQEFPQDVIIGKRTTINGPDLSYPSSKYNVKVSFSMTGSVPSTFPNGDITLLRVQELGPNPMGAIIYKYGTVLDPYYLPDWARATVTFQVTNPDGTPISHALVHPNIGGAGYTDANGIVVFNLTKDTLSTYTVLKFGYETAGSTQYAVSDGKIIKVVLYPNTIQPTTLPSLSTTSPPNTRMPVSLPSTTSSGLSVAGPENTSVVMGVLISLIVGRYVSLNRKK